MGDDVDVQQQMIAGGRVEREAPGRVEVGGTLFETRTDLRDGRFGRNEADPLVRAVETAAHEHRIVTPPLFVAARQFDGESVFGHTRMLLPYKDSASRPQKQASSRIWPRIPSRAEPS